MVLKDTHCLPGSSGKQLLSEETWNRVWFVLTFCVSTIPYRAITKHNQDLSQSICSALDLGFITYYPSLRFGASPLIMQTGPWFSVMLKAGEKYTEVQNEGRPSVWKGTVASARSQFNGQQAM